MTSYVLFTIQSGICYDKLKQPLEFKPDPLGLSNWVLRFPLTIFSLHLQQKHVFNEDSVTISTNSGALLEQKWKYFVITQQNGLHVYCTSQVYYERGLISNCLRLMNDYDNRQSSEEFYIPRCIVFLSSEPYFKIHVNLLKIHAQIKKSRPNIFHPIKQQVLSNFINMKSQGRQWNRSENDDNQQQPSVEMVLEYYMEKCNEHKFGQTILYQKSSKRSILHLYHIKQNCIFQFSHFFNLPLSLELIQSMVCCMLLQKQIIVTSKSQNLNVMIIESLLQLIRPLKWQHMLVHSLPGHLIEAASQNFMPFLIGVHKKFLSLMNTEDKYVLIVDQGKLIAPHPVPTLDFCLPRLSNQYNNPFNHSYINEAIILQHSIQFICELMDPSSKDAIQNIHKYPQFYKQFYQTTIYDRFKEQLQKGQLKQFQKIASILNSDARKYEIRRRLYEAQQTARHPILIDNEMTWMQFYLKKQPKPNKGQREEATELTLKQLKLNQNHQLKRTNYFVKQMETQKYKRSNSHISVIGRKSKSGQKLKLSLVRAEKCHPFQSGVLERKIGTSLPKEH